MKGKYSIVRERAQMIKILALNISDANSYLNTYTERTKHLTDLAVEMQRNCLIDELETAKAIFNREVDVLLDALFSKAPVLN